MWKKEAIEELTRRREQVNIGGGEARIKKQHDGGKLTARERLDVLFDKGTFTEVNSMIESRITDFGLSARALPGDGVVIGFGQINGRLAFASSEDFTVIGGTMGEYHLRKIAKIIDMAIDMKAPFIMLNDSGGARIEEGISSLAELGRVFFNNTKASGLIPQISVIMGACAGGACYSPAITDFVFMVKKKSFMFITGPAVIKQVTSEEVTSEDLGGSAVHTQQSGVAHFEYEDDESCLLGVRKLLTYLPQHEGAPLPVCEGQPMDLSRALQEVVVDNQKKCYDARTVIGAVIDKHSFMEIQSQWAKNAVVGLGRIDGSTVGFVANQPSFMSGSLDFNASDKIARFVRFCDCFSIPVVTFVDVPAFLPGSMQEKNGLIRHGAKILYAYSEATVPKITVILRKAYGGAYIAMCSKELGADVVYAWPIAEIAVMGADGAISIVRKKVIEAAEDKEAERKKQVAEYEKEFLNPYIAASRGYVDEVIAPEETREKIACALKMLATKQKPRIDKKHGNIPL